ADRRARVTADEHPVIPERVARRQGLNVATQAAAAALAAADGDEAEAVVLAERSGLARFAASEVHQPTLIENVVVTLRIVRDGKSGWASTNRIETDGLRDLAARAGEAAASALRDGAHPGLAAPEP